MILLQAQTYIKLACQKERASQIQIALHYDAHSRSRLNEWNKEPPKSLLHPRPRDGKGGWGVRLKALLQNDFQYEGDPLPHIRKLLHYSKC